MGSNKTKVRFLGGLGETEFVETKLQEHRFPLHIHDTFVLQYVTAGVDYCCGNQLAAHRNGVFVHFPFAAHTGGTLPKLDLSYQAIYPSIELVSELTGVPAISVPRGFSFVPESEALVRNVKKFFDVVGAASPNHEKQRKSLKHVFDAVFEFSCSQSIKSSKEETSIGEVMTEVRGYITKNFDRDVTVEELSKRFSVSRFYLIRQFKQRFGITPRQFLISLRVAEAKKLLANGLSVAAAAHTAGFADQSHLTRQFKRITSYCPGEIRANSKTG